VCAGLPPEASSQSIPGDARSFLLARAKGIVASHDEWIELAQFEPCF
jgi:hypothetical protein